MSEILSRVRADLAGHREELMAERERLEGELAQVDNAIDGLERILGAGKPAETREASAVQAKNAAIDREALRHAIVAELQATLPEGLTTVQLAERLAAKWPTGWVTPRRIGANCCQMTELTGDGERWYFVPAGQPDGH
ncbi:MAG TPA: hypothetical protein VGK74_22310 [Symbiobacteriaceae bacterium]|jgi:hypothetical protein